MQNTEAIAMIVVMPVFFGSAVWMLKIFLEFLRQQRLSKMLFEAQNKVLDKFGNSPEVLEYLQSDAGRKVFDLAVTEKANPRNRILSAVQVGVVLSALAVGILFVRGVVPDGAAVFTVVGVLGLCLGIGFLVSAGASYYLSRSWGLFNGRNAEDALEI